MHARVRRWTVAFAVGISGVLPTLDVLATGNEAAAEQAVVAPVSLSSLWALRVPRAGPVVFQGIANFDDAGAGNHFVVYPAPNVIGLLAAMATHGALVESAKKANRERIQAASDAVLAPYKGVLDGFSHEDLLRRALPKLPTGTLVRLVAYGSESGAADWVVDVAPAFSLTQDQRAIILYVAIAIGRRGVVESAQFRSEVRIVSHTADTADPKAFWNANDGEKLKDLSALLVAESLEIAFRAAAGGTASNSVPERTVRFMEGSVERMERAQVLENHCGRLLIRNLRGLLMSVPASVPGGGRDAVPTECAVKTSITN